MQTGKRIVIAIAAIAAFMPGMALAHEGHHHFPAFFRNLLHPWIGFELLLAVCVIGLWAARRPLRRGVARMGMFIRRLLPRE